MSLDSRVVVAGGGRVGFRVADLLQEYGHTPIVVERDGTRCRAVSESHVSMVVEGDATSPEILREATVGRSDAVAAVTGDGATNVAVCAQAREIAPEIRTVARADSAAAAEREANETFVDGVVYPEHAGARLVLASLLEEGFEQFVELPPGFEAAVFTVADGAPVDGKRVEEISLPVGGRLVGDVTRSAIVTGGTRLESGNRYLLALDRGVADEVRRLFEG
ncbi:potassium channel family protein [Salinigranum salinum]|uniref:potassium channel family protein n=1 Tax=Salinigranum salinum TaxID=1364937 RepID=UPI001261102C|nr:NAD-binding protein [Salinigranum salinum]